MKYPRIYLVADNCFAIKRWVKPREWMALGKQMGVRYMQASCDNEIDPLYCPQEYRLDWLREVKQCERELDMKVCNFYTGYQTYRTMGLAFEDERVLKKLREGWFAPMIETAAQLSAGIGFYMAALSEEDLQNPKQYKNKISQIARELAKVAQMGQEKNVTMAMEQMYNPASPPWTIEGTKALLRDVYAIGKAPFYTTIDVGHMVGQAKFVKPDGEAIRQALREKKTLYVGSEQTRALYCRHLQQQTEPDQAAAEIVQSMEEYPHLFSIKEDTDPYEWLSSICCYSPIVHLQQNDGRTSHHAAFTEETNKTGIIDGEKVLRAIAKSYEAPEEDGLPPRTEDVYLSFEIFGANTETGHEVLEKMKKSVEYWRRFIPEDGLALDQLI